MDLFVVSYELGKAGVHDHLVRRLAQLGAKRIMTSHWIMKSSGTAANVKQEIMNLVDPDCRILVVPFDKKCAWNNLLLSESELHALLTLND